MRSTAHLFSHASRSRANSISFVGLGRMGSEMAYNLFAKRFANETNSRFLVFDAVPEVAAQFINNFRKQFHGANINVANNPEECAPN
jgi:3-hydroxyisobutyrate dehydrogenase